MILGFLLILITLLSPFSYVDGATKNEYSFSLKQGDSVSYKINTGFNSSGSLSYGTNGTKSYFFNVTVESVKINNISVQINSSEGDFDYSQIYFANNQSVILRLLLFQGYPVFFIPIVNLTIKFGPNIEIDEKNNLINQTYDDSWACRSCGNVGKDDKIQYIYDLNTGWLLNSTEIYTESRFESEHFSYGYAIYQTNIKAVEWNINSKNSQSTDFANVYVIFSSFMVITIFIKTKKRKS